VLINTGQLVKRLRRERSAPAHDAIWSAAAQSWGGVTRLGAAALSVADALPAPVVTGATDAARAIVGSEVVPRYDGGLPRGGAARRRAGERFGAGTFVGSGQEQPLAVYVPACVNSMFGPERGRSGVTEAFVRLLERAGVRVIVPAGVDALCCGTPWTSKGVERGRDIMQRRVRAALEKATGGGLLPVVTDASSCTEGFAQLLGGDGSTLTVVDAVEFARTTLLARLGPSSARLDRLVLHPTCSSAHLGLDPALREVAAAVARDVVVPDAWGCCGFAGDRGMLHPELTAAATAPEAAEVRGLGPAAHASCNRTCELGMTRATGMPYQHVLELLEEATRPSADA